uniref:Aminopeptidase n=1 Tax=Astyanax mexicanus TaxID=7994 RepID=A0A8B9JC21_ASTMX
MPSAKKTVVGILVLIVVASIAMVIYFLPRCTFSKDGCHKANSSMEHLYPVASNGELFPWRDIRLPTSVRPVQYELSLFPNLTTMTFQGNVTITLVVLQESKKIVLHSSDMKILKANFQGKEVPILEYKPWQQIAIKFSEEIKKGQEYVLNIVYTANLSNSYDGFYNSSYSDTAGVRRVLAATQFEPLAARKAFPCFDEPAFKASFLIKIKREAEYISLSNMPKAKTTPLPGGLFEDEFEKSVNMSTYLVAFIVANFVSANANVSNTLVSVYAVPDKKDQVHYALEAATKLLHFYNTFFEIEYPLRKLDLVGIPDFLAGAMENWGLITFRETTLLVGNHSSPIDKQLVTSVIAHELAHQWFGNLVTMRWWNDLWLNEGFATYMQYMSIEKVFPELDIDNEFLSVRFRAMAKDSLNSSHPVSSKVTTPEEVEEMFDSVSYEKGASILLMLNATLSEEAFRKGVIEYLTNYRGGNTENEDLWSSLSQVNPPSAVRNLFIDVSKQSINVSQMMNTWTVQKGFPLVTVNRAGKQVKLTQEHFLLNAENATDRSHLWHIPLTYVNDTCSTSSGCKQVFLFKNKTATLEVPDSVKWLKFNYKSDGFYIVDYGMEGWMKLTEALKTNVNVLPHEDRASLINNLFSLSSIPGDLLRVVLSVAAQTEVGWKELFDTYKHSIYDSEKRKTLEALATSIKDEPFVPYRILNAGLEGSEIQTPELPLVISTVCKHYAGYLYAWDFVKENWDKLTQKFPIGSFPLQAIIMATTSQFSTKAHLDEVERFFGSLKDRGSQMRSIQEAIETIKLNMRWMDRNLATLQTWL